MNKIETLIDVAIEDEFYKLATIREAGAEEARVTVDSVTKLLDRKIEMERLENERAEKEQIRKIETERLENDRVEKEQARKDERTDRIVKNCLTGVSVIGGLALTVWGSIMSWKFEENGTITSTPGRKFMSNLFFKK